MSNDNVVSLATPAGVCDPLTDLLRAGARRLIEAAVSAEFEAYLWSLCRRSCPTGGSGWCATAIFPSARFSPVSVRWRCRCPRPTAAQVRRRRFARAWSRLTFGAARASMRRFRGCTCTGCPPARCVRPLPGQTWLEAWFRPWSISSALAAPGPKGRREAKKPRSALMPCHHRRIRRLVPSFSCGSPYVPGVEVHATRQHRPCGPCVLVFQRHPCDVPPPPFLRGERPEATSIRSPYRDTQRRARAVDQQRANVAVAAFADTEQCRAPARRPLARHQPQPRRHLPPTTERRRVPGWA